MQSRVGVFKSPLRPLGALPPASPPRTDPNGTLTEPTVTHALGATEPHALAAALSSPSHEGGLAYPVALMAREEATDLPSLMAYGCACRRSFGGRWACVESTCRRNR